jgi:hypothetical protein
LVLGGFDLGDVGAPVGQLADSRRPGPDPRQVEDDKPGQGPGTCGRVVGWHAFPAIRLVAKFDTVYIL